jgi:hypothetical protein
MEDSFGIEDDLETENDDDSRCGTISIDDDNLKKMLELYNRCAAAKGSEVLKNLFREFANKLQISKGVVTDVVLEAVRTPSIVGARARTKGVAVPSVEERNASAKNLCDALVDIFPEGSVAANDIDDGLRSAADEMMDGASKYHNEEIGRHIRNFFTDTEEDVPAEEGA